MQGKGSLLFQRDRQWLVQLSHAVLSSKQTVHVMHDQGDGVNVYEGYKHNGIAQVAISSCESVVVPNASSHVGYDSRLDALRHSVEYLNFHPPALIRTELQ